MRFKYFFILINKAANNSSKMKSNSTPSFNTQPHYSRTASLSKSDDHFQSNHKNQNHSDVLNQNINLNRFSSSVDINENTSDSINNDDQLMPLKDTRFDNDQNEINTESNETENLNDDKWKVSENVRECRDRLRRALRYHFLSYGDQWKVSHQPQGKLIYQFIKAIFVIIQLYCLSFDVAKQSNNSEIIQVMMLIYKI